MLKQIIGGALLAVMLQSTAFAAGYTDNAKVEVENKLEFVFNSIDDLKTLNLSDYDSPEIFANFREVTTTGMKPKTLYRTSNPMDIHGNKFRHKYADSLAKKAGVKVEIDLADTDENLARSLNNSGVKKKYCYGLYKEGKLLNMHLGGDGLYSRDWPLLAKAFRFMLDNEGPYLVHCTYGRDRAGFVAMLCEALAGATIEDLRKDYMQTYVNYYHLKPNGYEYSVIQRFHADKIIYYIAHPDFAQDKKAIPDNISVYDINPKEAAENFFKTALQFSDEEVKALQNKLSDGKVVEGASEL